MYTAYNIAVYIRQYIHKDTVQCVIVQWMLSYTIINTRSDKRISYVRIAINKK